MEIIQIIALSVVVFYITQENTSNGFKIIKIPIYTMKGIVWICFKVPFNFVWSIARYPTELTLRLAWLLSKIPIKMITPEYLKYAISELIKDYEYDKKLRKIERKNCRRAKRKKLIASIKNNKIFNQKWDFINKNWLVKKFKHKKKPNPVKKPVTNNQKQPVITTNNQKQPVRTTNNQKQPVRTTNNQKQPVRTTNYPNQSVKTTNNSRQLVKTTNVNK